MSHRPGTAKRVYELIKHKDRTLAELCLLLDLEYRKGRTEVEQAVMYLEDIGFMIYEAETGTNIWYGILPSHADNNIYKEYLANI